MIGEIFGPYRIIEQLGSGGMGVVYKAQDTRLGRTVALKFLPPQFSEDARAKDRFMQEARAASALDHANICTIHDIAQTEDGRLFIVMTYYDGRTLKYLLQDGALPVEKALDIALQTARGLARAHEAGIVHRDVKPANIMVTERGEVKVLDFGVAKLSSAADLTREGSTIGTAAYMSPEQARGDAVDPRADQWSIGILLYEMLTGTRPFGGGYDAALVYAILNEEPAPVESLRSDLKPGLAEVVGRAISKQPDERFSSTEALIDSLEAVQKGPAETAFTGGAAPAAQPEKAPGAGRVLAGFAAVAVVTLALLWAAMMQFGLPGWVFTLGAILMGIGLPVMAWAARAERRRADLDTGERRALTGFAGWLSVRKAAWGGVLAMSGLAFVAVGYMVMRAAGIGPAATLISSGALEDRGLVVVADFENRTEDPNLGISVTEAFRIDLSESPVVNVMDNRRTRDVLERMERDPETPVSASVAREIAERAGAKAVIAGDVSSVGAGFVLSARILNASDGAELIALRENASDDTRILDAIDRLSGRLRGRVGESLVSIRGDRPLEDVTTSSLEALRLYTEADQLADRGDYQEAADILRRVVAIDSTFGMAYRKLAVVLGNSGASQDEQARHARRAYELRDQMSDREALLSTAYFYNIVEPDADRVIEAYEQLLEEWPHDLAALNNLSIQYRNRLRFEEAAALTRRALAIQDGLVFRSNLLQALAALERWDDVRAELDTAKAIYPDDAGLHIVEARMEYILGNEERVRPALDSALADASDMAGRGGVRWALITMAQREGRFEDARRLASELSGTLRQAGLSAWAFNTSLNVEVTRLHALGRLSDIHRGIEDYLARFPLEEFYPANRPDGFYAAALARAGRVDEARRVLADWERDVPDEYRQGGRLVPDAFIAMAEGRPAAAFDLLARNREALSCPQCWWDIQGEMYMEVDSVDRAIEAFERFRQNVTGFDIMEEEGAVSYRLGGLYERRGDLDQALEAYRRVTDVWADADPEIAALAAEAQTRIDRILDMQAREPDDVPQADS